MIRISQKPGGPDESLILDQERSIEPRRHSPGFLRLWLFDISWVAARSDERVPSKHQAAGSIPADPSIA
jgi:hypothetical protein